MLKKYQIGGQPQPALDMDGTTPGEVYRTPVENRAIFDNVQDLGQFLEPLSVPTESTDSPVSTSVLKETELVADAMNMDLDSFFYKYDGKLPQEVLTAEKLKKEAVPLERISGESIAPNIYRENRTKVLWNGELVDACAAGMQYAMSSEETPNHMSVEDRKKLGIRGNAWHVGKNLEDNGGKRLYGLHEGTAGIMDTNKLRAKLISNQSGKDLNAIHDMADTGDIVEMYYPNSTKQQEAALTGTGTYTTHVGMVSTDAEGRKYVTHNIGGTWHTDDLATVLSRTGVGNYFVSGIVRPAYEQGSSSISVNGDFQIKRSTGKTEPVQRTPEEIKQWSENFQKRKTRVQPFLSGLSYYAPYVQEDMGVSNENMKDLVIPVSYALFGNESMFNDPDNAVQTKIKNRDLIRGVKNIAGSIGLDSVAPDIFDPMSEGLTQIKLDSEYLGSKDGKELLTRYGIDEESIYDVSMSAAATQLLTAYNLKKLRGFIGPEKFDGLDLQTKRNLLLKAHNKGVDTVIQRDLLDEGIEKGLKTYGKLHIQEIPEDTPDTQKAFMRYTNTGNDFALELNVDYEKILKDKETADRIGYNVKPLPTFTEAMANSAEDGFSTLLSNAYSTMNEVKGSIGKIASEGKKLYENEGKRSVKTIAKRSEVEGQKLFAEMLRIGTITGDTGEMLQDSLNTATSSVQEISKAISQDMQRAAERVNMDPLDVKEHIARQTFENKIPKKITELSDAAERVGSAMAAPRYRLQEFNAFMEMEGISIPMSVQQKIMLDPRFQDGSIELKDLIEEYLGKSTGIPSASVDSIPAPDNRLADLLIGSEQIPQMKYGGSLPDLPKYQNGTPASTTAVSLPPLFKTEDLVAQAEYNNKVAANQAAAKQFAVENPSLVYKGKVETPGKIDYPSTDRRSTSYVGNPNLAFAAGNTTGASRKYMEDAFNTEVAGALLFEGIPMAYRSARPIAEKAVNLSVNGFPKRIDFNTYLSTKDAAAARAKRMLSQTKTKIWNSKSPRTIKNFENVDNNLDLIEVANPSTLGTNSMDRAIVYTNSGIGDANISRIAAHEVGHFYRNMGKEAKEWNSFFDFSSLPYTTKRYLRGKTKAPYEHGSLKTTLFERADGYYHGDEIRERAAQLKDHIAFKNNIPLDRDFTVTMPQLNDAIKTYIKDTGLDNTMSPMLKSLRDKKGFLNAMNKYPLSVIGAGAGLKTFKSSKKPEK